ncbi:MAG: FAD-dependent monooxygenase [Pirellulales bacterium]|nr:FAD-dependent monooxygenase [Pirellulales bacterium]
MTCNYTHQSCDVLVAGAGPVGLTAAMELTRHGLKCRIVDRMPLPSDKSKALVLWARTLELLENAGIADQFVAAGIYANGASIYGSNQRLLRIPMHADGTAFPRPLMLAQSETERLLNENLLRLGGKVERPVELTEMAEVDGGVEATLVHGDGHAEHVRASWLVGCDGAHSTVRKGLKLPFAGEFEPNDWLLADVQLEGPLATDEISAYWHSEGVLIFFPFAHNRFRVIADLGRAKSEAKTPDPTLDEVQSVVDRRGPIGVRLFNPVWLSGFRIHERKVSQYGVGRIFLAGDAAHVHSPAGGQGMNTGMQDAFNLAWKLALVHRQSAARAPREDESQLDHQLSGASARSVKCALLDSYTIERSAVGDMVLRNAGMFTKVATVHHPVLQFLRNHVISLVGKLSAVQERAISQLTELAIHYPDSPLNGDDPGAAWGDAVKPGDRLPDAELTDARTQNQVRLYEAIRGTEHDLLLLPTNDAAIEAMSKSADELIAAYQGGLRMTWIVPHIAVSERLADRGSAFTDVAGLLRRRLDLRDSAFLLVRPDKYIGFRGHATAWPSLRKHLAKYLCGHGQCGPSVPE